MRRALLVSAMLWAARAYGDDARDVFGLPKSHAEAPIDCGDGKAFGCVTATDPLAEDGTPYALSTWLSGDYLLSLPVGDATDDQVAHYAMGAGQDDVGPTFGGATGLENRWLIDGAPVDNVVTGGIGTRIPLVFLDGMLVTAGGFAARDRVGLGGVIDARLRSGTTDHELDIHAWVGWSASDTHPPILADTYQVRRGLVDPGQTATVAVVATGPIGDVLGGHAWYAAGVAPRIETTHFTWHAATLVDANDDGIPDGLPGIVTTAPVETTSRTPLTWSVPAMARVGLDSGVHHVDLTLIGTVADNQRYLFNSTLQAAGVDEKSLVGDAIATWRGTWHDTHAKLQATWHRDAQYQSALDSKAANLTQLESAYVPATLAEDPKLAAACDDTSPTDPYPKLANCPVPAGFFASGGAGLLTNAVGDRPSISGEVAHQIGGNVIRVGATGEDARLVTESKFTGGFTAFSLFPGEMAVRHFLDPNVACSSDITQPCPFADSSTVTFRTRYTAAYAEDTWRPAPNISVDGGLRWELMWVGTVLHYSDELAPRLGASWDFLGDGRSRAWVSMGRSFALLPTGLGQTIIGHDRYVDVFTSSFGTSREINTGAPTAIAPGIQPVAQDELTAGVDVVLARAVRARVWLQGNWLRRGLETDDGVLDNPGRNDLVDASRDTQIVAGELQTAPTAKLVLRIGYMYGRTVGTWAGPFDPREGVTLYNGSDFDASMANMRGPLPTDVGGRLYVEGQRAATLGPVEVAVSTRLTVASGVPRDILGSSDAGVIYLLPRGSGGRGPLVTQANLRLAARYAGYEVTLDLFNVFDQRTPTEVSGVYSASTVEPIDNGTPADLVFLRDANGPPAIRNPGYNVPTEFQVPFSAMLGAHKAF